MKQKELIDKILHFWIRNYPIFIFGMLILLWIFLVESYLMVKVYEICYEGQVKKTISEMVKEEALK